MKVRVTTNDHQGGSGSTRPSPVQASVVLLEEHSIPTPSLPSTAHARTIGAETLVAELLTAPADAPGPDGSPEALGGQRPNSPALSWTGVGDRVVGQVTGRWVLDRVVGEEVDPVFCLRLTLREPRRQSKKGRTVEGVEWMLSIEEDGPLFVALCEALDDAAAPSGSPLLGDTLDITVRAMVPQMAYEVHWAARPDISQRGAAEGMRQRNFCSPDAKAGGPVSTQPVEAQAPADWAPTTELGDGGEQSGDGDWDLAPTTTTLESDGKEEGQVHDGRMEPPTDPWATARVIDAATVSDERLQELMEGAQDDSRLRVLADSENWERAYDLDNFVESPSVRLEYLSPAVEQMRLPWEAVDPLGICQPLPIPWGADAVMPDGLWMCASATTEVPSKAEEAP